MSLSMRTDCSLTVERSVLDRALRTLAELGVLGAETGLTGSITIVGPNAPLPSDHVGPVVHVSQSELDQALGALYILGVLQSAHLRSRLLTMASPEAFALTANEMPTAADEEKSCDGDGMGCSTACLCRGCEAAAQRRFYAVICGLDVGVFEGWDIVQPLLFKMGPNGNAESRFKHARSHVFTSQTEAEARFRQGELAGEIAKLSV